MKTLNLYLKDYNLRLTKDSGKEIVRQKDVFFTHTGIVMGENIYTGKKMIFHNHPDSGPAIVSLSKYAAGNDCYYTNKASDNYQTVLIRSFQQLELGSNYNLMTYNCQDATSFSRAGQLKSHGRNNTLGLVGVLALMVIFLK